MELLSAEDYWVARWLFEKSLALIYFVAFLSARNQFPALLGERGLLPVPEFLRRADFRRAPSLFHLGYSDRGFALFAWTGMALSLAVMAGAFARAPIALHVAVWLALFALYLSIVNVGQRFYAFGWESMLVETGFFAAFLGPGWLAPSWIPLAIFYWMLFRVEVGAGLIKLRHDSSWRDLTALYYHHETQPLPNPSSWFFHRLPRPVLRLGVAFSHAVQVGAPFALVLPQPFAVAAAGLIVLHQFVLIVAGNYSWLNWLTVVLALLVFSDVQLAWLPLVPAPPSELAARPIAFEIVLFGLAVFTLWLSVDPLRNLFSKNQLMNYSWNAYHLVCAYGAFGSMTKVRYEIVLEGTPYLEDDPAAEHDPGGGWREYGFRAKPGDPARLPPQVAPYHLRLDWLMWFLPFSVTVLDDGISVPGYERWFVRLVDQLLIGDLPTRRLFRHDPFPDDPPARIRARYYRYRFTTAREQRESGCWWQRELLDDYLPPVSRADRRRSNATG